MLPDIMLTLTHGRTNSYPRLDGAGGGGGGGVEPLPGVFDILQYFGTILPLVESLWSSAQDEVYFMGGGAVGGCDVTNNGRHLGRHLGFYRELEIKLKPREMVIFCALYEK